MPSLSQDPVLRALVDACGPDYARVARPGDLVAGRRASYVALPATPAAIAEVLQVAAARGLTALPRGSGSKVDWGAPHGADVLVDTVRLGGLWAHDVAAGVAEVGTGTPVRALQAALALRGQRLPVDPPSRTATVGGMLATNESGPLRLRFGTPAGHVERATYADTGGERTSDGEDGRPGLAEIEGVITSATVRVVPVPEARRWVGVAVSTPLRVLEFVREALASDPSAIEVDLPRSHGVLNDDRPPGTLAVLFEGDELEVADRADRLRDQWGRGSVVTPIAPPWWGRYPFVRSEVALRLSAPTADLPAVIYALGDAAGVPVPVRGSVGLGGVHAVLPGSLGPRRLAGVLDALGHVLMARDGRVSVVHAPPEIAAHLEMATRREFF